MTRRLKALDRVNADPARGDGLVSSVPHADTIEPALPADAEPGSISPRLHPYDGLFLRAAHLDAIQDHAESRLRLLAAAGGSGVVVGLEPKLGKTTFVIGPGYGVDPAGHVLSLAGQASLSLPADGGQSTDTTQTAWVITLVRARWYDGSDQVYGDLCDDPCGPDRGKVARPYIQDGVRVRLDRIELQLRADLLSNPRGPRKRSGVDDPRHRRSRVVSAYFERERSNPGPLVPGSQLDTWKPTFEWAAWSAPEHSAGQGIPLGLLWWSKESDMPWHLDIWAARRERIDTPSSIALGRRLSMRPWGVFLAQINQFQMQLGAARPERLIDEFIELPPAGYVPVPSDLRSEDEVKDWARSYFNRTPAKTCVCPIDHVAGAIRDAQFRDRIDLMSDVAAIEFLLPESGLVSGEGSWLAFRRHSECTQDNVGIPGPADQPAGPE